MRVAKIFGFHTKDKQTVKIIKQNFYCLFASDKLIKQDSSAHLVQPARNRHTSA
jgi:hypothetical protein